MRIPSHLAINCDHVSQVGSSVTAIILMPFIQSGQSCDISYMACTPEDFGCESKISHIFCQAIALNQSRHISDIWLAPKVSMYKQTSQVSTVETRIQKIYLKFKYTIYEHVDVTWISNTLQICHFLILHVIS